MITLWGLGLITPLDHLTFNSWLRTRGPIAWDSRIVVVKVDDETLADLGQFPIERHYYTSLVEQLTVAQASAVGFNIMFLDASIDDQALAKAIEAHGRVVLGQTWDSRGLPIQPNPTLQNAAIAAGHLRQPIDSDGISRRVEVTAAGVAALGVEVAQVYSLVAEAVNIPHIHELWINWPGDVADLSQYSLSDVLAGEVPLQVFQDKIVLVGVTATGLATLSTPYNIQPPVGSVYLHAAVVNTLLQENWLRPIRPGLYVLLLASAGIVLGYYLRDRSFWIQICIGIATALGWLGLSFALLYLNIWFPAIALVLLSICLVTLLISLDRLQANVLLQVRSEFLSTMSHEIRTPMNAIIGTAELLRDTPMRADQQEYIETIYTSSQTLLTLINDILDFSKIESGKFELEEHPIQLAACIEQSLELVAHRANKKNLELAYLIEPAVPPVFLGDEIRLRQILINLLSNAVKFTAAGTVTIRARINRLESRDHTHKHHILALGSQPELDLTPPHRKDENLSLYALRIDVQDSGIGIAPEQIENLFQPYVQASILTSRHYGGTGLGLAICRQLVKTMGGRIWADSLLGKGTTFSFAIPVMAPHTHDPVPFSQPDDRFHHQVLGLIESDPTRKAFLSQQLTLWGMTVCPLEPTASDWTNLNQAPTLSAVLINADGIPDLDSPWLHHLRQAAQNPNLPVLCFTHSALPTSVIASKGVTVVHKPIKRKVLFDALVQAIAQPSPHGEVDSRSPNQYQAIAAKHPLAILVAEDNSVNQKVIQRILERLGYTARVVSSGKAAVTALKTQSYDVVLMDMRMPEMDGVEATKKIRDHSGQTTQPWIIAMTANVTNGDRQRCLNAGMNDYLSKPIQINLVAEALQRAANGVNPSQQPY